MKNGLLVMALVIVLVSAAMAGSALAGDMTANAADPEGAFVPAWTIQGAIETGMLPDAPGGTSSDSRFVPGGAEFPLVEAGGVRYRDGLDTGP